MKTKKIRFILAGTSALLFAPAAFGQNGTWINPGGGSWIVDTNWAGGPPGVIANGQNVANFNTLDITSDTTVTLDGARTIRQLNFADTDTTSSASWILAPGSGGALNIAGGTARNISVGAMGNGASVEISAQLAGTVGFTKTSGGILRLTNAANTISGDVVVNQGTLRLNAAALSNANANVQINTQGTLGIGTSAANVIGGTISFNGGRIQYFINPGQDLSANFSTAASQNYRIVVQGGRVVTYSANLSSAGGTLDMGGVNGTLILEADNSYDGATTVTSGTLQVDGSTSTSSVSVGANGTLAGRGAVNGTLAVTGKLAPGDAGVVDLQTLAAGTTTWNGGSIWNFDLSSINDTSDKLNITGDFTKGSAGTYQFDFKGSTPSMDTTYTLVEWSGTTDFVLGDFSFTNLGGGPYVVSSFAFDGKSLTFTAVPEPPTAGFAGWITGFDLDLADQDPTDDPDNDGIDNLLEFVLNGDPSVSDPSILPKLAVTTDNFEFTYQRRVDSVSPETTQTFEWGTTLVTWPGSAVIPAGSGAVDPATITVSAGMPNDEVTDTVKISIPKTADGGAGKLFGRLQVVTP